MDKYLILENGTVFKGKSFGYNGEDMADTIGELVFTTKTTGYLETLSDPAYHGQIVLQTFPLIGTSGTITEDFGPGPIELKAYIVRQWCQDPSNFRCEGNLDSFLHDHKIPGLYDIDTRALTRVIRTSGSMNAMLSSEPELSSEMWDKLKSYKITNAVAAVCDNSNFSPGNWKTDGQCLSIRGNCESDGQCPSLRGNCEADGQCPSLRGEGADKNVAVWDFGDGFRSSELLIKHGCNPMIVSYKTSADNILNKNPDGIFLTGGPGDPAEYTSIIEEVKKICESVSKGQNPPPIFAVGLGHQLMALANGAKTEKMKFGNRGANQPVKENASKRAFVTKQNHGYTVIPESLPDKAVISYTNINDGSCEGINYSDIPAFSIQFEPTDEIMGRFMNMIEKRCENASK